MRFRTLSLLAALALALALALAAAAAEPPQLTVTEADAAIRIADGESLVLVYHKTAVAPPEGADPAYFRSGFIHPVFTPKGAALTGVHPDDHYHHLGLWHAWVKCTINGQEIDFWNLKKKTGRVRYASTRELVNTSDKSAAGFVVVQDHVAYLGDEKVETVILRETFKVTARLVDGAYEIDYETHQANVSEHALELPAYRYGGPIAYRAPHTWNETNSDYLSSEGKTRVDGHTTRSKYCAFWGPARGKALAHLAILSHPENHDFPQRMRVWPPGTNNGAIFFNYVPIQEHPWAIAPGATSTMRYRLVAADGKADSADLDTRWNNFAR